ncbi:hypothetical protein ACIO7M_32915 [Streptomyces toxytricini]|uniref:Uncharacterized protein n=1 Tax=Streptomyces toxytricini TaxID=67369 RepID=A0ABW8ERI8_STRT5
MAVLDGVLGVEHRPEGRHHLVDAAVGGGLAGSGMALGGDGRRGVGLATTGAPFIQPQIRRWMRLRNAAVHGDLKEFTQLAASDPYKANEMFVEWSSEGGEKARRKMWDHLLLESFATLSREPLSEARSYLPSA